MTFAASTFATLAMIAFVARADRHVVYFDLVAYHTKIGNLFGGSPVEQRLRELGHLFGLSSIDRALGLQVSALVVLACIGSIRGFDPTLQMTLALFLITLLPRPIYVQYFVVLAPFLVELAVVGLGRVGSRATIVIVAAYAVLAGIELRRHTITGDALIGIDHPSNWSLASVRRASQWLDAYRACGPLASNWPGYLVESQSAVWPGMENHFGFVAGDLEPDASTRRDMRVLSTHELDDLALTHEPHAWVVAPIWTAPADEARLKDYVLLRESDGAALYGFDCR